MTILCKSIKHYAFPLILMTSILLGALTGYCWGTGAKQLKPLGDIFLNLIFTAIVPLLFFSVSSAVARAGGSGKLAKILVYMAAVFTFMSLFAAICTIIIVLVFSPAEGISLQLAAYKPIADVSLSNHIVGIFTVPDFSKLLSHEHMLALIVFSVLVGLSVSNAKEKGRAFSDFLQSGEEIFMRVFSLIMYYAPIGFYAYFAVLVSDLGPSLMGNYLRIFVIYYTFSLVYFFLAFTVYAYLAGNKLGVRLFWKNSFLPIVTSLATCSSAASIPANLLATKNMRVAPEIVETVIPLGSMIHKQGSVIGGVIKIAFLFGLFHLKFTGLSALLTAVGVSMLVGTVMGAIPSGGMLGELLILSVYGFPPSVLMAIAAISIIIDPLATMLNVMGNSIASMLIARLVEGKRWIKIRHNPSELIL